MSQSLTCCFILLLSLFDDNFAKANSDEEIESLPASCLELHQRNNGSLEEGIYTIRPNRSSDPFLTYCTKQGFTLVMKVNGGFSTFEWDSDLWTSKEPYHPFFPDLDHKEAKLSSFWTMSFTVMQFVMETDHVTRSMYLDARAFSLYDLLKNGNYEPVHTSRNEWLGMVAGSYLEDNCNQAGFNTQSTNSYYAKARIGILGNNENDCNTCDSAIGVGLHVPSMTTHHSAGNEASFAVAKDITSFVWILVQ